MLVILDRDGVINEESEAYIKTPEEWFALPRSLEAIAQLTQAGHQVAIATNQDMIGRGLTSEANLGAIHEKMQKEISSRGGRIDFIAYCPHAPWDQCDCRKPK